MAQEMLFLLLLLHYLKKEGVPTNILLFVFCSLANNIFTFTNLL